MRGTNDRKFSFHLMNIMLREFYFNLENISVYGVQC